MQITINDKPKIREFSKPADSNAAVIHEDIVKQIATKMAEQSINDSLDAVLDMMFIYANNETRIIPQFFKDFI